MSTRTTIEWTDYSFNAIRADRADGENRVSGHYCEKVSSGCANCYASRMQPRFGMPEFGGQTPLNKRFKHDAALIEVPSPDGVVHLTLNRALIDKALRSKALAGKRVFVCDMSDLFGWWVPDEWIDLHYALFALRPDVTWQVLTKRPERMAEYCFHGVSQNRAGLIAAAAQPLRKYCPDDNPAIGPLGRGTPGYSWYPLPNVWAGTSVEDQPQADQRIIHLLRCPAAVRFLSVEPMLGPVELEASCGDPYAILPGRHWLGPPSQARGMNQGIDWVICGGESGPGARPMHIDWARSLRDQCQTARVPFFFKQWGAWLFSPHETNFYAGVDWAMEQTGSKHPNDRRHMRYSTGHVAALVGKKKAGRVLDGRTWDEMPQPKETPDVRGE